jgi:hypothetical protein
MEIVSSLLQHKGIELGWKLYLVNGKLPRELPKQLKKLIDANDINPFQYPADWYADMIFYKGDPETTVDWIFVTTGAGYYKVGTKYSVWHTRADNRTGYLYLSCEFPPFKKLPLAFHNYFFY